MADLRNRSPQSNARRHLRRLCIGACLLASVAGGLVRAQQSSEGQSAAKTPPTTAPPAQTDGKKAPETVATPPQPAATDPHQAQIIADTQKLLKLSQELKAEVAKSNKDTLSLAVVKKAEEVEKQAKALKEELNKSH
jgi:type VI protein secretion system component VasF